MRRIWFIADDYGFAPGVSAGILELIELGRLSGTGCMPLYADWPDQARRLRSHASEAAIGLHLTLTDQPALAGASALAPQGKLPGFGNLVAGIATGRIRDADIHAEIDAQLARFGDDIGTPPAYVDGHQHVHFLPPVRRWLKRIASKDGTSRPWLRGAPARPALGAASAAKISTVRAFAARFDVSMRAAGYDVIGPLSGFYDWSRPGGFVPALEQALRQLPDRSLFMCHPGHVDELLLARDSFTHQREAELSLLKSGGFTEMLEAHGAAVMRP